MGLDECGCVGATAKGAARRGIKVKMLKDCIASRFPETKVVKMREQLRQLGVEYELVEGSSYYRTKDFEDSDDEQWKAFITELLDMLNG